MGERSAFDEYLFGGGLEADAKKGVAQAIAKLKAAGIEPVDDRHRCELVKQATDIRPEVIRTNLPQTALSRDGSR